MNPWLHGPYSKWGIAIKFLIYIHLIYIASFWGLFDCTMWEGLVIQNGWNNSGSSIWMNYGLAYQCTYIEELVSLEWYLTSSYFPYLIYSCSSFLTICIGTYEWQCSKLELEVEIASYHDKTRRTIWDGFRIRDMQWWRIERAGLLFSTFDLSTWYIS